MKPRMMRYEIFDREPGVLHGVTLRDPSKELDFSLALHTGQAAEAIGANRRDLEHYFGAESQFVSVLQVHGERIWRVKEAKKHHGWETLDRSIEADGLVTDIPGVVLTILTADCVPILCYDPGRKVIAAVHAGWKGSRLGIAAKAVRTMTEEYGSDPGEIRVAIGPSIGGCCYEVGSDVAAHFMEVEEAIRPGRDDRFFLDLKTVNRRQILEAGVLPEHIETSPICTACERERFFSYRAEEGCDGRFMSCIMIEC